MASLAIAAAVFFLALGVAQLLTPPRWRGRLRVTRRSGRGPAGRIGRAGSGAVPSD